MTDIHDIRSIVSPDLFALLACSVLLILFILFFIFLVIKSKRVTLPQSQSKYKPNTAKQAAINDLIVLKEQVEIADESELTNLTSKLHNIVKTYLGQKFQRTLNSMPVTALAVFLPNTFSPILLFCYSMIYPWQKRSRIEILSFIDTSIDTIQHDS